MDRPLTLQRRTVRRISPEAVAGQLARIASRALSGSRRGIWDLAAPLRAVRPRPDPAGGWVYLTTLRFRRVARRVAGAVEERQFALLARIAAEAAQARGWRVGAEGVGAAVTVAGREAAAGSRGFAEVRTGGEDVLRWFGDIYDREAQIAQVHAAITAARLSGFRDRFHCLLYGPPACGKTAILQGFKAMLGSEACLEFDATSTTAAGASKVLMEAARIPPILVIEELEKCDEASLRWLLSVADQRSEIRRTNWRDGDVRREVRLLVLATANDIGLFRSLLDGALPSRFPNQIHCPRPDRRVLERILVRELDALPPEAGADRRWIAPALDFCLDVEKTDDPRRVIAVCKCGRDKLLTGEYQQTLTATMDPDARARIDAGRPEKESRMTIVIAPDGIVRTLYTEDIDLAALGRLSIRRASYVEPDADGRWWVDLAPVGGPRLGPFERRSPALDAEQDWLETHRLNKREDTWAVR